MNDGRIIHDSTHDALTAPLPPARERPQVWAVSAAIDVVVVVIFAALGRSTHASAVTITGVLGTAWPFLVGLALAWLVLRVHRRSRALWPTAVGVWGITWATGIAVRAAVGTGIALPFVLVAAGSLALLLIGWRLLAKAFGERSLLPGLTEH